MGTVRIVHFSDLHGQLNALPEADLYVCTGDLMKNYPRHVKRRGFGMFGGTYDRVIDREKEERMQRFWIEKQLKKGSLRRFLGSPDAPVACVRGNHDFTEIGPAFGGTVHEFNDPSQSVEFCGLSIGGFRGVNHIAWEWSDEMFETRLAHQMDLLPTGLDVLISHTPPQGLLDTSWGERIGSGPYRRWIEAALYEDPSRLPRLMCFGHCHHGKGTVEWTVADMPELAHDVILSNAATGHNALEITK